VVPGARGNGVTVNAILEIAERRRQARAVEYRAASSRRRRRVARRTAGGQNANVGPGRDREIVTPATALERNGPSMLARQRAVEQRSLYIALASRQIVAEQNEVPGSSMPARWVDLARESADAELAFVGRGIGFARRGHDFRLPARAACSTRGGRSSSLLSALLALGQFPVLDVGAFLLGGPAASRRGPWESAPAAS